MRNGGKAFLAISLLLVCVSVEIISRDSANPLRSFLSKEAHGFDVAEQTWIHCRKELKGKNKEDCPVYVLTGRNIGMRGQTGYRHWFRPVLDCTTSYPKRKLISKKKKFVVSAPNFALGPTPDFAPSLTPGPAPASRSNDRATSTSPSQPSSHSPVESPDESNSAPVERKPSVVPPSQSVPAKKYNILKELIIAVASTAVLTFFLVALLFLCCFRPNRGDQAGPRNGLRDEGQFLHLVDSSPGSNETTPTVANPSSKFFSATSKTKSFLSKLSLKTNSHDQFPTAAASSSAGLPPLKLPPGRSAAPPPPAPAPAPPPPQPPPPPPPKSKPPQPPKLVRPPPAPPKGAAPKRQGHSLSGDGSQVDSETGAAKTKLKPFFWDKMANPDQKMVWHEISAGSFQLKDIFLHFYSYFVSGLA